MVLSGRFERDQLRLSSVSFCTSPRPVLRSGGLIWTERTGVNLGLLTFSVDAGVLEVQTDFTGKTGTTSGTEPETDSDIRRTYNILKTRKKDI